MNDFDSFKQRLDVHEPLAWNILKTNVALVVKNECKRRFLEPSWLMLNGKLIDEEEFYSMVYGDIREGYSQIKGTVNSYLSLKDLFMAQSLELLKLGFGNFMHDINHFSEAAWKRLDYRLRPVIRACFIHKNKLSSEKFEHIYHDSLVVFCENLQKNRPEFTCSKSLKSYLIRIADIKIKEYNRLERKSRLIPIEEIQTGEIPVVDVLFTENNLPGNMVWKLLELLNDEEREILYGVYYFDIKLKDLAKKLNLSEESCRIKKFRALKKLKGQLARFPQLNDLILPV